jgi:hypothetical protein
MHPFWRDVIEPLLDLADASVIAEVGVEQGRTTGLLLERAARRGGTVHAIDPAPRFDVARAELEHGTRFRMHRARSHDVLGLLPGLDAALLDGDHNWFTVHGELDLLARRAEAESEPLPLVIAHDAGWPYGRRDMYYDPEAIPAEHRHDCARAAILPGRSALGEPGINGGLWNATKEGGERNGVLTAIEDFAAARPGCKLAVVGGWHGLAVLADAGRLRASPRLEQGMERLRSPEFLGAQIERLEMARIITGMHARTAEGRRLDAEGALSRRDYGLLDDPAG